jgi:hypothetical protein
MMYIVSNFKQDEAIKWRIMTNLAAEAADSKETQPPGKCTRQYVLIAVKTVRFRSNPPPVNRYYAATATGKRKVRDRTIIRGKVPHAFSMCHPSGFLYT